MKNPLNDCGRTSGRFCCAAWLVLAGALLAPAGAWAAPPVVRTVPWVGDDPLKPHDTWSGRTITLKGTCDIQGGNVAYTWDFGDGSGAVSGTVSDRNAVQATHAYTGPVGLLYSANLTIKNTATGESTIKSYYVQIRDKTLAVEVNVAIDEGLWYLFKNATRSGTQHYWSNTPSGGYEGYYANPTASAVQAFEVHGHHESQLDNPYGDAVRGGLDFLLSRLRVYSLSLQGGENPDSNANGYGLSVDHSDRQVYELGAVMDAIVASRTPDATAQSGLATYVLGRRYQDIVQDMVDMYAWGQCDSYNATYGGYIGGWRYGWGDWPDNSAAQWGAIGMAAAERTVAHWGPGADGVLGTLDDVVVDHWGVVPQWVKDRNKNWLNYSYNAAGYFGYTDASPNQALSTGPCGMVQMAFDGIPTTDARWAACESYLRGRWSDFIATSRPGYPAIYYSYYAFMKAMRLAVPQPVVLLNGTLDWYNDNASGLARILVNRQNASGYWTYDGWPYVGSKTAAAWNLIILSQTLFEAPPVAVAKANPNPAVVGQMVQLDGSESYHLDTTKLVDSWEWDLGNDGLFDVSGPFPTVAFFAEGDYTVVLRVTDNGAPEQTDVEEVLITVTPPPVAPTADAGGPYSFCPGAKPWFLDGTDSTNPDEGASLPASAPGDTIQSYLWDLDSDNAFDDAAGPQPDVTAFFTGRGPGRYLIQLKVTDTTATSFPGYGSPDLSGTDTAVVTVRDAADPECACVDDLTARPKPGKVQLTWTDTGAHHYNVYRGTVAGGPYLQIASTTSTYSTFLDYTVVNGTTYYYVVREADFLDRETCQSNEASARPRSTR